jgi:hypothetical protein
MINNELQRALSVDSYVDPRHTLLLTETMTRCGTVSALNRNNMENLGASTLACAAFERTLPVLEEAAFYGLKDPLRGSLERQILGLPLRVGTGIVHTVTPHVQAARPSVLAPLAKTSKEKKPEVIAALLPVSRVAFEDDSLNGVVIKPLGGFTSGQWTPYVSAPLPSTLKQPCHQLSHLAKLWQDTLGGSFDTVLFRVLLKSTESELHTIAEKLQEYLGWDNPLECGSWIQTLEVVWAKEDNTEMCSISNLSHSSSTGKALRFHIQKTVVAQKSLDWLKGSMQGLLTQQKTIASDLIPDTILPLCVRIRHRCTLIKDGWTYTLQKLWEAPNIMECEIKVLSEPPKCTLRVTVANLQASHAFPSLHVEETLVAKLTSCL